MFDDRREANEQDAVITQNNSWWVRCNSGLIWDFDRNHKYISLFAYPGKHTCAMADFPTPGAPRRTTLTRSEGPWSPCPQLSEVAGGLSSETCQSVWGPPPLRKSGKETKRAGQF